MTTFHGVYGATNALKKLYNSVMVRSDRVIAISDYIGEHIRQRRLADSALQAGARLRAWIRSTPSLRINRTRRPALARILNGLLVSSGNSIWRAPTRGSSRVIAPPDEATSAVPPWATIAAATSMQPRSAPPVCSAGSTCRTTGPLGLSELVTMLTSRRCAELQQQEGLPHGRIGRP